MGRKLGNERLYTYETDQALYVGSYQINTVYKQIR